MEKLKLIMTSGKRYKMPEAVGLLVILIMLWPLAARLVEHSDPTSGYIDRSIWLLVLMSVICFLIFTSLCWWLLDRLWSSLGLPALRDLVLQFKALPLCYQLGFFWASFCLLLLAAVGCLIAIC